MVQLSIHNFMGSPSQSANIETSLNCIKMVMYNLCYGEELRIHCGGMCELVATSSTSSVSIILMITEWWTCLTLFEQQLIQ